MTEQSTGYLSEDTLANNETSKSLVPIVILGCVVLAVIVLYAISDNMDWRHYSRCMLETRHNHWTIQERSVYCNTPVETRVAPQAASE